ncbi:hypothetical protein E5D57_013011 [Metarhizium anisopliae]|nr:hypothetical protein E5D57_013011 [Metarhizium anisopliae]
MPQDHAPHDLLAPWVKYAATLEGGWKNMLLMAGEIATRLLIVCPYIQARPLYCIEDDVDQICRDQLKSLTSAEIVEVGTKSSPRPQLRTLVAPRPIYKTLFSTIIPSKTNGSSRIL